ncbi:hypothetical protein AAFF_G00004180 [Aldrovandia affinis]|uniref:Uncharacterized protein n=1 Tax=Aldrovandia affinis TaxID=143900 RepID=A0AAD7X512_9TELE|nr:hypothetical protein AAFF_G00004180 [Aldrovandia affinis]
MAFVQRSSCLCLLDANAAEGEELRDKGGGFRCAAPEHTPSPPLPSSRTPEQKSRAGLWLSWSVSMATLTSRCDRQSGPVAMVIGRDIKPKLQLPWHHTYWLSSYFCAAL